MWPAADRPAMAFTSIGKKVTRATTAAFDGQSKPNHITMIGAMPTSGSAEKKLPSGKQAAAEKFEAMREDRDQKPGAAADRVADQDAANEGLDEIGLRASAARPQTSPPRRSARAAAPAARRSRARQLPRDRTPTAPNSSGTSRLTDRALPVSCGSDASRRGRPRTSPRASQAAITIAQKPAARRCLRCRDR